MNLPEFKAWFEGFGEGIDQVPTPKQWAKIQEKVAAIVPEPTKIEYVHQYWNHYRPYWRYYPYPNASSGVQLQNKSAGAVDGTLGGYEPQKFTAEAFKAMGRAEFAAS